MSENQPKPDSKHYSELIADIEKGTIKIPKFQREFVWSLEKTAGLLDSIVKGYPIGTFILWQTNERLNDIKNIGNQELPAPPDNAKVEYVLDGQQRITSLFAAYRGMEIQKKGEKKTTDYKDIFVNLDESLDVKEDAIVTTEPIGERSLPLHEVLNAGLNSAAKFNKDGFTEQEIERIGKYNQAFTTYDFSIILLKKDDISAAIDVFTRINTGGQVLTLFEIMSAKTYDEEQKFDMQKKWDELVTELDGSDYETVSGVIILQLLSLYLSKTKECKRQTILQLDKQDVIETWDKAVSALKYAVDFFRTSYKIPVSKLLPYDALLVPFAYFFLKQGETPTQEQAKYLRDFFWRVALSHRYSSATESKLAQDIRRVDLIIDNKRPDYKDIRVHLDNPEVLIETQFSAGSSYCKAVLCLLAASNPKDFHDGADVILNNSWLKVAHSKNYHHFFPKSFLNKAQALNANSLMNITLVSDKLNKRNIRARAPKDYLNEFKQSNSNLTETMKSHFVDIEKPWLSENNYEKFLKMRAEAVFKALEEQMITD